MLFRFAHWLRTLRNGTRTRPFVRHRKPVLETLEQREAPAVNLFSVTNTLDAGAGSLRQAILDANATTNDADGPDIIQFNIPGAGPHTIALQSGFAEITDALA